MRVLITRPAGDASQWVAALQAVGHEACALPLIDVGPATQTHAVVQAWRHWPNWQAVMFVSAQAVRVFFAARPADVPSRVGLRYWATGPGTHKALLQAGVPDTAIDSPAANAAQFDSEALWQRVGPQVPSGGRPVLIVRGRDGAVHDEDALTGTGRDWLAQQLQAQGVAVHFVVAYERRAPAWTTTQIAQARRAATDGSVWCFSSSQAVAHLAQVLPEQSWSQARCLVTHPRIAQVAKVLGFSEVCTTKPVLADLLASLESLA
jgi:uroporphyrinogen-III synthase